MRSPRTASSVRSRPKSRRRSGFLNVAGVEGPSASAGAAAGTAAAATAAAAAGASAAAAGNERISTGGGSYTWAQYATTALKTPFFALLMHPNIP